MQDRVFEFWLGRAGSGKTRACLDAIARQIADQPRGSPLIFLVPEQASAQMEYALATHPGLTGYTRAKIATFDWLRKEVFRQTGGAPRKALDEEGRVLLLRQVIRRKKSELKILGDCADLPGLAETVAQSLIEFQRYGWTREDLANRARTTESDDGQMSLLQMKLHDLELLWGDYDRALAERGLADSASVHRLAAQQIRRWPALEGARVWIDGFASFTAQERDLLEALLSRCEAAALTLCLDPRDPKFRMPGNSEGRTCAERVFANIEASYASFRDRMAELGWRITEVEFPRENQPTRFVAAGALAHLESRALTRLSPEPFSGGKEEIHWPRGPVEMIEAEDARGEILAVARRLAAIHRDRGWRWSEMTLITRDLEMYAPYVREIFPRFGVPFFLDELRRVSGHPVARLVLSAVSIAAHGWQTETILDYLKCGLSPLQDMDAIARIENVSVQRRLMGSEWMDLKCWLPIHDSKKRESGNSAPISERELYEIWRDAARPVVEFAALLRKTKADPALALWQLLEAAKARPTLERWIEEARATRDEETALSHESAWETMLEILDRLNTVGLGESARADETTDVDLLLAVLQTGLATVRAGLIPPTLDQVLVGSVDRTRTPEVRAAFVVGMNDGDFPRVYQEDPILGDGDRRTLTEGGGDLGPDSRKKFDHERFLAYIALTRASEYLFISRPIKGSATQAGGPSSFFRAAREAFPQIPVRKISGEEGEAAEENMNGSVPLLPEEWAGKIARAFHGAIGGEDPKLLGKLLLAPNNWLASHSELTGSRIQKVFEALDPPASARLYPQLVRDFWREQESLSVTGLESYAQCPFKFFASRMMRLERPREPIPGPQELGSLRHSILKTLFERLKRNGRLNWEEVDLARANKMIDDTALEATTTGELAENFGRDASTATLVRLVAGEIKHFIVALKRMGERSGFVQVESEFRLKTEGTPPFQLPITPELSVVLSGTIDRIDECASGIESPRLVLFDYKSGKKKFDPARAWAGADLQLPAYALALEHIRKREGARVSGFFYWPLSIGIAQAEGEEEAWAEPGTDAWFADHKVEGIFADEIASLLDHQAEAGEKALAFPFKWTSKKKLHGGHPHWLSCAGFGRFMEAMRVVMVEKGKEIAEGRIPARPIRRGRECACDLCDFHAFCRIGTLQDDAYNDVQSIKLGAFQKMMDPVKERRNA